MAMKAQGFGTFIRGICCMQVIAAVVIIAETDNKTPLRSSLPQAFLLHCKGQVILLSSPALPLAQQKNNLRNNTQSHNCCPFHRCTVLYFHPALWCPVAVGWTVSGRSTCTPHSLPCRPDSFSPLPSNFLTIMFH